MRLHLLHGKVLLMLKSLLWRNTKACVNMDKKEFKAPEHNEPKDQTDKDVTNMAVDIASIAAAGYLAYLGVKWIVAIVSAPATGGGSLIVEGVTP